MKLFLLPGFSSNTSEILLFSSKFSIFFIIFSKLELPIKAQSWLIKLSRVVLFFRCIKHCHWLLLDFLSGNSFFSGSSDSLYTCVCMELYQKSEKQAMLYALAFFRKLNFCHWRILSENIQEVQVVKHLFGLRLYRRIAMEPRRFPRTPLITGSSLISVSFPLCSLMFMFFFNKFFATKYWKFVSPYWFSYKYSSPEQKTWKEAYWHSQILQFGEHNWTRFYIFKFYLSIFL